MTSKEEKALLQQITYLSKLISHHKHKSQNKSYSTPAPKSQYVLKNTHYTASQQALRPLERPVKPIEIPAVADTGKILINPNFHRNKTCGKSVEQSQTTTQSTFQPIAKTNDNLATTESFRPRTILVNPNYKGTKPHINSKIFTTNKQEKTSQNKCIDLVVETAKPRESSLITHNKPVRQSCTPNKLINVQQKTLTPIKFQSNTVTTVPNNTARKYIIKNARKLVASRTPNSSITPAASCLVAINKRKLVRLTPRGSKFVEYNKHKASMLRQRFLKTRLQTRLTRKVKKGTKYQPRPKSAYKYVRDKNKFKLNNRANQVKTVKKYSVRYKNVTNAPPNKTYRYRKLSSSLMTASSRKSTVINVRGQKFVMDAQGKTLKQVPSNTGNSTPLKKIQVAGMTYTAKTPNVYVRTNDHALRTFVSQAKYKSISVLRNKRRKNNQPCVFYHRFGKCIRQEKGTCPCVHDPKQVAICKKFLRGQCEVSGCLLSHDVRPEKMPTCQYFLAGCCMREACPYLHVKVNARAQICTDFLVGYCAKGNMCKKRHVNICPEYDKSGKCSKTNCPYPHTPSKKKNTRTTTISSEVAVAGPSKGDLPEGLVLRETCTPKNTGEGHCTEQGSRFETARYYQEKQTKKRELSPMPDSPTSESTLVIPARKKQKLGILPPYIPL